MARKLTEDEGTALPSSGNGEAPAIMIEPSRWRYRVLKAIHLAHGTKGIIGIDVSGNTRIVAGGITDERAYYPKEMVADGKAIPTTYAMIPGCINGMVPSAGHGRHIPVDLSGEIRLTREEVMGLRHGDVEPIDPDAPPVPSGLIDIIDQEQLAMARGNLEGPGDPADAFRHLAERVAGQEERMRIVEQHIRAE